MALAICLRRGCQLVSSCALTFEQWVRTESPLLLICDLEAVSWSVLCRQVTPKFPNPSAPKFFPTSSSCPLKPNRDGMQPCGALPCLAILIPNAAASLALQPLEPYSWLFPWFGHVAPWLKDMPSMSHSRRNGAPPHALAPASPRERALFSTVATSTVTPVPCSGFH